MDRMGRPGQYDDEQAMLREEAEAMETMDDMQRAEYLRAKGTLYPTSRTLLMLGNNLMCEYSLHTSKPSGVVPD